MKKRIAGLLLAAVLLSSAVCFPAKAAPAPSPAPKPTVAPETVEPKPTAVPEARETAPALDKAERSPLWITGLKEAKTAEQLFVVAGVGETTAYVSMHEKDRDGVWRQLMTTPGFIGKHGLGKTQEGDGKTPTGTFSFNYAFGIAEDPGCAIEYHRVDENSYWSGDMREGFHYNEMVDLRDCPELDLSDSEHIVDYANEYQYCLNISYNAEGTPGLGSAIFLHCLGPVKPYTGGCVAIPRDQMLTVMRSVRKDCVVVIDSLRTLSPETWKSLGLPSEDSESVPEEDPLNGIAAVYCAANGQVITREDGSKDLADTVIYIYKDGAYRQYIMNDGKAEVFSEGVCVLNGRPGENPTIVTLTVRRLYQPGKGLAEANLTFDINLSSKEEYCLYPIGAGDRKITAAFLQADKQKLVRKDGTEEYLPTMWFYYNDGTFCQFALLGGRETVLFSSGDYYVTGSFADDSSVLTIHRDRKYADGVGLAPYDSTHDYVIGELDFLRIYPEPFDGPELTIPESIAEELLVKTGEKDMIVSVYEKASVEAAAVVGDPDGAGWLFSIGTVGPERLHTMLCGDMSGAEVFAADDEGNVYVFYHPTDVRLVREGGAYSDDVIRRWTELNEWAATVPAAYLKENPALSARTYDNSEPAMALSRAAYGKAGTYTLSSLQYGQHGPLSPKGTDAAPFVERLIRNAKYTPTDDAETPDGEYIVLYLPEDDLRLDFFLTGRTGNYVRLSNGRGVGARLYQVMLSDGEAPVSDIAQEWVEALAADNGLR